MTKFQLKSEETDTTFWRNILWVSLSWGCICRF